MNALKSLQKYIVCKKHFLIRRICRDDTLSVKCQTVIALWLIFGSSKAHKWCGEF